MKVTLADNAKERSPRYENEIRPNKMRLTRGPWATIAEHNITIC